MSLSKSKAVTSISSSAENRFAVSLMMAKASGRISARTTSSCSLISSSSLSTRTKTASFASRFDSGIDAACSNKVSISFCNSETKSVIRERNNDVLARSSSAEIERSSFSAISISSTIG